MFISSACMISLNTLETEVECVGSPQCVDRSMDTLLCLEMSHTCIWSQVYIAIERKKKLILHILDNLVVSSDRRVIACN